MYRVPLISTLLKKVLSQKTYHNLVDLIFFKKKQLCCLHFYYIGTIEYTSRDAHIGAHSRRSDFEILDEPFYAAYLKKTGIQHPMFDEIIKSQSSDYKEVSEYCKKGYFKKSYQYQSIITSRSLSAKTLAIESEG